MMLSLLLQASQTVTIKTSTLNGIFLSLAGTAFAALLSFYASWRASSKASVTAHRVAELTTQTNLRVAEVASLTAKEIKEVDYRDDFYKKLINKRLEAWEAVAKLINATMLSRLDLKDKTSFFSFCRHSMAFEEALNILAIAMSHQVWLNTDCLNALDSFNNEIIDIGNVARNKTLSKSTGEVFDSELLRSEAKGRYLKMNGMLNSLVMLHAVLLEQIQDVPSFLNEMKHTHLKDVSDIIPHRYRELFNKTEDSE
jgi:hypothetical protein